MFFQSRSIRCYTPCSRVTGFTKNKNICDYDDIKNLYNLRSEMVHGRIEANPDSKENLNQLAKLEGIVVEVLGKMLLRQIYRLYGAVV